MKRHFERLIVLLLIGAMTFGMTSSTAWAAPSNESVATIEQSSELMTFTSTEDLVAAMKAELAAESEKIPYDMKAIHEQEVLAALVKEKSGCTLDKIKSDLGIAIFTNRNKTTFDVLKYNLTKEEIQSVTDMVLKGYHALSLVTVTFDTDVQGIATTMHIDMSDGFAKGLDELDKINGVGEIAPMTTQERSITSQEEGTTEGDHTEHTYGDPTFQWADDYSTCTATFTCTECEYTETVECTVNKETTDDNSIIYTATCTFNGKEYTDTCNATTKQLYADWAAMCEFYQANTEYYGIPVDYWLSKETETTPLGAIKVLAGFEADTPIPAANMDQIITGLTQALQAYVKAYGNVLLETRKQALDALDDNMTDLQKCLVLHDYIALHSTFDMSSLTNFQNGGESPDPIEMTPFGALLYGKVDGIPGCVCLGYTAAYVYLIQSAFPDIYRNEDGNLKTNAELDENDSDIIDFVMIRYDADVAEVSVAGVDSGFEGRFTQPHFFNAVKLDGQWYYVDTCYDDIEPEVLSQYRVETDGNVHHLYFLCSQETLESWYDGYYKYIDTLHGADSDKPCNNQQYEDAWFSNINSPVYYDDVYWYYVNSQISYSQMWKMFGKGGMDSLSMRIR